MRSITVHHSLSSNWRCTAKSHGALDWSVAGKSIPIWEDSYPIWCFKRKIAKDLWQYLIQIHSQIYKHTYIYIYTCVHIYVQYIYIYVCVCMYAWIYIICPCVYCHSRTLPTWKNSLSSPGVNASPQWSESFRTPCPGISGSIFGLANGYVQFIDIDDDDDDDTTQKTKGSITPCVYI